MSARIFNIIDARKGKTARMHLQWVARLVHPFFPESVSEIAAASGYTRQGVYKLVQRTLRGLTPLAPGPAAGSRRQQQIEQEMATLKKRVTELEAEIHQLKREMATRIKVDEAFICRLIILMPVLPVSVRDMHRLLVEIVGRTRAPSKSAISRRVQRFGRLTRTLTDRTRLEVGDRVKSLLSDEIFYGPLPTLIAMETTSRAALAVERVQQRDKETDRLKGNPKVLDHLRGKLPDGWSPRAWQGPSLRSCRQTFAESLNEYLGSVPLPVEAMVLPSDFRRISQRAAYSGMSCRESGPEWFEGA